LPKLTRIHVLFSSFLFVGTLALAVVAVGRMGRSHPPPVGSSEPQEADTLAPADDIVPVKVIRPKRAEGYPVSVQQLAVVEPYYHAHLKARASGVVRTVTHGIGDHVRRGELLIEIDVPDLDKDVEQKGSVVEQRKLEHELAKAELVRAQTAVELARTGVLQRQTEVRQAVAHRDYRARRLARFKQLATRDAINPDLVDEQTREAESADAGVEAAHVAVQKAQSELAEKQASLAAARAEVNLRSQMVRVAEKDLEKAAAVAGFGRLTAPFDGVVTRRNIDPGTFVQNATSGAGEPLLSVARTDVVTVSTKLPDNAAPFVAPGTEAVVTMDDLPGLTIAGRVTRSTPLIEAGDRTTRVEVDLFNGDADEYRRFLAHTTASGLAALAGRLPVPAVTGLATARFVSHADLKGAGDFLPVCPTQPQGAHGPPRLLPGMTGTMRVLLDRFTEAALLPSSAVFSKGGKPYVLLVEHGVTRLAPVKVQVDDGRVAKVALVEHPADARHGGARELLRDLTGREEVVASRQLEVGEGQKVRATAADW
jgi:multidrug resistance efflux pump